MPRTLPSAADAGVVDPPSSAPTLDRLARLAARVLDAPVALVVVDGAAGPVVSSAVGVDAWGAPPALARAGCARVVEGAGTVDLEDLACADGWVACLGAPLTTPDGHALGALCVLDRRPRAWDAAERATLEDLAAAAAAELERRRAARALEAASATLRVGEAEHESLLATLPLIVYRVDPRPPYAPTYVSAGVSLLGYTHAEWMAAPDTWLRVLHPEDRGRVVAETEAALAARRPLELLYRVRARDGEVRWIEDRGDFVYDASGEPVAWQGVMLDVTPQQLAEEALRQSEARFRAVFDQAAVGVSVVDDAGRLVQVNTAFEAFLGYEPGELTGRYAPDLSPPEDAAVTRGPVADLRAGRCTSVTVEKRFVRRDGAVRWASLTISRIALDAERRGIVGVTVDVTERRALERRLAALSEHDELTGLLNRRGFRRMLEQAVKAAGRTGVRDALLFLDLDRFKPINDTHGHAEGDRALRAVADVLRRTVRDADFVGRVGGDEFAAYAVGLRGPGEGHVLAARLQATLAAHNREAAVAGCPYAIGFSVGVAEVEPGDTAESLLARADAALYVRKMGRAG
jgi:diguanylate cyclase (GGDEF)-like protein/PAS domain S-box-containing protein